MNKKALTRLKLMPLKKFLEELGGWNILEPSANDDHYGKGWNFQENLLRIHRKALYPLFRIAVDIDARNSSRHILTVGRYCKSPCISPGRI